MLSKDTLKTFNIWLMLVEEPLRKFIATLYDMLHEGLKVSFAWSNLSTCVCFVSYLDCTWHYTVIIHRPLYYWVVIFHVSVCFYVSVCLYCANVTAEIEKFRACNVFPTCCVNISLSFLLLANLNPRVVFCCQSPTDFKVWHTVFRHALLHLHGGNEWLFDLLLTTC